MVVHRNLKCSAIQCRFDKYIFHLHRISDCQLHRLPDTCRIITIESVSDVFQHTIGYRHCYSYIDHFIRISDILHEVAGHFHHHEILSRFEQLRTVRLKITEHTDMRSSQLTVDIHFSHLGYSIEVQYHSFSLNILGQFHPLTIPGSLYFIVVESIVLTTVCLLLEISIGNTFCLSSGSRLHRFTMQPDTHRIPEIRYRHYVPVLVVRCGRNSFCFVIQLISRHK